MILILILFGIFIAFIAYYIHHPPNEKRLKNIPGPQPKFLIGNADEFPDYIPDFTKKLLHFSKEYGSPVKFKLGHIMYVNIFKAQHVEAALKHNINITKSYYDYEMIVKEWLGDGLLISKGEKWHKRRKMLTPAFHYGILRDFIDIMNDEASILVDKLRETSEKQIEIDICPLLSACALDIICETAMGKKLGSQLDPKLEYTRAVAEATELIVNRSLKPWLWYPQIYYLTNDGRRMKHLLNILQGFTRNVIKEREASRKQLNKEDDNNSKRQPFLDLLLDLKDVGKLNLEDIRDEVDTFMFEGHDTTASSMMWACYSLGRHPHFQNKVRQEISDVVGDSPTITSNHLTHLKYLECFIKETMRMYPPVPVIGRKLEQDMAIDDTYIIPAGTMLNINFFALHRDEDNFPSSTNFDPSRFEPENCVGRHPFSFTPFSAGPRNCIGQKFAMMEEKVILAHIIRNFSLEASQLESEMEEGFKLILKPFKGVLLKLKPV